MVCLNCRWRSRGHRCMYQVLNVRAPTAPCCRSREEVVCFLDSGRLGRVEDMRLASAVDVLVDELFLHGLVTERTGDHCDYRKVGWMRARRVIFLTKTTQIS